MIPQFGKVSVLASFRFHHFGVFGTMKICIWLRLVLAVLGAVGISSTPALAAFYEYTNGFETPIIKNGFPPRPHSEYSVLAIWM